MISMKCGKHSGKHQESIIVIEEQKFNDYVGSMLFLPNVSD